jgi:hypothetical protein
MRTPIAALLLAVTAALPVDAISQNLTCGMKPIANTGKLDALAEKALRAHEAGQSTKL